MTYTIQNETTGKMVRSAISGQTITFNTASDAQIFAASLARMARSDNIGRRPGHQRLVPTMKIVEAPAMGAV